jgi:transposase
VLLPELEEGQVLIMDKLPAHKPNRMRELIEARGCELLCLPSYSPDYNPIEEAFSKIKEILRRAWARTRETLLEALGEALSAISSRDAWGFFEHAAYHPTGQLL